MIGLVPGMENQVTIRLLDKSGKELESRSFTVTVPKPVSGYDVVLKSEAGESAEPLTDGLYYTLGTQGYYGYMFFFLTTRELCAMRCCWTVTKETGDVSELLDLRNIFPDYYDKTEKVSDTDPFFWQAGTRDWIHLNTIDYTRDDGLILSSRETSTIIKIGNVHSQPELTYLIGDRDFWEETPYADYVYEKDRGLYGPVRTAYRHSAAGRRSPGGAVLSDDVQQQLLCQQHQNR